MIDPKEFLNKEAQEEEQEEYVEISGTFICQECSETVKVAKLNEEKRKISWKCSNNHRSDAKL